jgi:hypothetical protein
VQEASGQEAEGRDSRREVQERGQEMQEAASGKKRIAETLSKRCKARRIKSGKFCKLF